MDSQKFENLLNLALDTEEGVREVSPLCKILFLLSRLFSLMVVCLLSEKETQTRDNILTQIEVSFHTQPLFIPLLHGLNILQTSAF